MFYPLTCTPCNCRMCFIFYLALLTCNCRMCFTTYLVSLVIAKCFTFILHLSLVIAEFSPALYPLTVIAGCVSPSILHLPCNCKLFCTSCLHQGGQKPVLSLSLDHITEYSTWCHLFFFFFFFFFGGGWVGGGVSPSILHFLHVIAEGFTCLVPLKVLLQWNSTSVYTSCTYSTYHLELALGTFICHFISACLVCHTS